MSRSRVSITFPEELAQSNKEYPTVVFSVNPDRGDSSTAQAVMLYMPPGLAFGDSMAYNTFNLGALGSAAQSAISTLDGGGSLTDALTSASSRVSGDVSGGRGGSAVRAVIAADVAKRVGVPGASVVDSGAIGEAILFNQKVVQNPNANTSFQSSNLRTFAFNFKMVAQSAKETEAIKEIVKFFRYNMYPEGDTITLSYPPLFNIKFYNGASENRYIPRIYDSYLIAATATYNSSTNAFHADGSPVEVDVALTFQEAKALLRSDIKALEG